MSCFQLWCWSHSLLHHRQLCVWEQIKTKFKPVLILQFIQLRKFSVCNRMSTLKKYCQNPKDIGTTPLFPFHSNRTPSPCIWEERFEQLAASKLLQLTLHFLCQWFPAILLPPHLSHGTLEYCLSVQTTDASSYVWKTKEKHTILLNVAWRLSLRYRKFSLSKNYFRVNQLRGL